MPISIANITYNPYLGILFNILFRAITKSYYLS